MNQFRALLAATDSLADAVTAAAGSSGGGAGGSQQQHLLPHTLSGVSVASSGYSSGQPTTGHNSYIAGLMTQDSAEDASSGGSSDCLHPTAVSTAAATAAGAAGHADGDASAAAAADAPSSQLHRLAISHGVVDDGGGNSISGGGGLEQQGGSKYHHGTHSSSSPTQSSSPFARAGSKSAALASSSSSCLPGAIQGPLELLGELMLQSHASYSACGLGSDGTNRLVNIVRQHMMAARRAGTPPALYGAKITGGGSGGTVCVLGLAGPAGQAAVDAVAAQYREETGYQPFVFAGSSMGAVSFGHLRVKLRHGVDSGVELQ